MRRLFLAVALAVIVLALAIPGNQLFAPSMAGAEDLTGRSVCVDPGHGGGDPGAVGYVTEKNVNLGIALKLAELLEADGAEVILTRDDDYFVSLQERVEIANSAGCDIFVSIHANAASSTQARGIEVYHYPGSQNGKSLAYKIFYNLQDTTGLPGRFVKGAYYYVLVHTSMPAVLVETGFVTNQQDATYLASEEGQWQTALGILYGIQEYFGVEPHNPLRPKVLDVRTGDHITFMRFVIDLDHQADYTIYYWQDPPYLAIRVYNTTLSINEADGWRSFGSNWYVKDTSFTEIPKIYATQYGNDTLIVLATNSTMNYVHFTLTNPDRIVVDVYR